MQHPRRPRDVHHATGQIRRLLARFLDLASRSANGGVSSGRKRRGFGRAAYSEIDEICGAGARIGASS